MRAVASSPRSGGTFAPPSPSVRPLLSRDTEIREDPPGSHYDLYDLDAIQGVFAVCSRTAIPAPGLFDNSLIGGMSGRGVTGGMPSSEPASGLGVLPRTPMT